MRTTLWRTLALASACGTLAGPASAAKGKDDGDPFSRSVVRIYAYTRKPNTYQPWQMREEQASSGSGCVIEGGRILTNAHVVSDQVYLQVRRAGETRKYPAKVEFVGHDTELAVLRVADPSFLRDARPIELGSLPRQRDKVEVYGFPVGGEDLSVTEGIVSRIEVTDYSHTGRGLLTIQTDAAINPGNSGGPALLGGRLVGVAFQISEGAEGIGYIVPAPLIARFLKDISDGRYDGVPDLGVLWQALENPSFREFSGLGPDESGVRISTVVYGSSAWGALRPGDVLTAIDRSELAEDGSVALPGRGRAQFLHAISLYQAGESARLGVIREGKRLSVEVRLKRSVELVEGPLYDVKPSYFVFGGLVFTPLTRDYLANWDYKDVPTQLKFPLEFGFPSPERRQVILLGHVLPHDVNSGYQDYSGVAVEAVNGRRASTLKDVIAGFAAPRGRYHVVEFDRETDGGLLVLDAAAAAKANQEILTTYGIPQDRSADLRE